MIGVALLYQLADEPVREEAGRPAEPEMFWSADEEPVRDQPRRARKKRRKPYRHVVLGRLTLATGLPRRSEHSELLAKDGYSLGSRTYFEAGLQAVLGGSLAIGPYIGYGARSAEADTAPILRERIVRYGGEASILLNPSNELLVTLGPQLGVLSGTLGVSHDPTTQTVFEFGVIGTFLYRVGAKAPVGYFGVSVAYTVANADPPGEIGRDYDYGALYLGLTGALGG